MLTNLSARFLASNALKNLNVHRNISASSRLLNNNEAKAEEKPADKPAEDIKKFEEKIKKYETDIADLKVCFIKKKKKQHFEYFNILKLIYEGQIYEVIGRDREHSCPYAQASR